ncbi:DDE-1 domain-containing protein [Nephila pilipes]|uniref:DDE-1 domain-containing protein n=1 Tax=Nephila pilipes TaxID=299642 RepID=A0A8X6PLI8_NEPPI|nr:DDE-1 domain-containing protein [Nephila pilipes]
MGSEGWLNDARSHGIHTVLPTPKAVAEIGAKQVCQTVSAERGELVTFCAIISGTGNTIPPAFVFPRVQNKESFLDRAPMGSLGLAAPKASTSEVKPFLPTDSEQNKVDNSEKGDNEVQSNNESNRDKES